MRIENERSGGTWLEVGFAMYFTDEGTIEINARERHAEGMLKKGATKNGEITDSGWEHINSDMRDMEMRLLVELHKATGITFREEGHNGNGDLVGSCWVNIKEHPEAVKFMYAYYSDDECTEVRDIEGVNENKIYANVHPVTRHSVDMYFGFIDIDKDEAEILEVIKDLPKDEMMAKLETLYVKTDGSYAFSDKKVLQKIGMK